MYLKKSYQLPAYLYALPFARHSRETFAVQIVLVKDHFPLSAANIYPDSNPPQAFFLVQRPSAKVMDFPVSTPSL